MKLDTSKLIGKTEKEASELVGKFRFRVTRKDKKRFMGTCDRRTDRVNIEIDNGKVTKASIG